MDINIGRVEAEAATYVSGAGHRLFLSHAGIDGDAALRLARRLENSPEAKAHGLKVWIDKSDLLPGGRWKDALQSALEGSTAFAVYVGSRGVINWVWDEVSVALDRAHKEPGYPVVPILATGARSDDLPSFLSQYQGVGDPERVEEFQKLLRAVLRLDPSAKVAPEREPFVGLLAFTSRKVHLFFGREQETDELIALLRETPFVMVTGDSGSGKSSLVLAGLVSAFRGGRLGPPRNAGPDETIWHVIETRPGTDPFGNLADSVRTAAERIGMRPTKTSDLADLVRTRQPDKCRDAVLSSAPQDSERSSKILVIVDQFEEFRTSPQAAPYVAALLRLATPGDDRIRVVLTMRRDYLYICDSLPDLRERLQGSEPPVRYLLHRMSREGLHAAITGPLALAGIEEPDREDLARAALKDVGDEPGELALLQMALWRTWSEAQGRGRDLVRAYIRIGRVEGALAQAAEEVFKHLSEEEQQRAETLFVRLIRPGEAGGVTRRVAHRDEFNAPTQALAAKLSEKEHWRLLASHEDTVEIAHEQLATQWLRYQRWITNNPGDPERGVTADLRGDDLRLLQQLIAETSRWQAVPSDGKGRYLATGANLELYTQLSGRRRAWLSDVECQFVQACNDAEQDRIEREQAQIAERERLLLERAEAERVRAREQTAAARKAWWLAVGLLVALVAVGAFWFNARQATTQAQVDGDKARMALLTVQARRAAEGDTPDEVERAGALAMESIEIARKRNWPTEADAVDAARSALRRLPVAVRPQGSPVNALVVLPDGWLASGGRDGQIKIWPKNFDGKPELLPQDSPVYSLKVLGDGRLASGGRDGQIKIWPKNFDGKPEVLLAGGGLVSSLVMLKHGRLASGSQDGKIRLWPKDLAGEPKVLPQGSPGSRIASLMALGDGRLVSGGDDGTIRLWPKDFAGAPEVLLGEGGPVSSLVTLSDGRLAAGSHDGKIRLWYRDLVRPPQVLNQGSLVSSLVALPDERLASGGQDGNIRVWPKDFAGAPEVLPQGSLVSSLAVLPDGRLASASGDGKIKIWPKDFAGAPQVLPQGSPVYSLAVLRDGRLVSGGTDGKIRRWPKDFAGEPEVPVSQDTVVYSLTTLADGRLASGGQDGNIRVWPKDLAGAPEILPQGSLVSSLVVLSDGRLASGSGDGNVRLWSKDRPGAPEVLPQGSSVSSLAVLPDGRLASGSGDGNIRLWSKDRMGAPEEVLAQGNVVSSLAVLRDGRLASGGQDGKIRIWPKDSAGEPQVLQQGSWVRSLAVLSDGRLASGGEDGKVRIWLVDEEKLVAALCLRAGRNLTRDEWAKYIGSKVPWQPSCRGRSNWRTPE